MVKLEFCFLNQNLKGHLHLSSFYSKFFIKLAFPCFFIIFCWLHSVLNAQTYATLPYNNDFESGSLDAFWTTQSSTAAGEILVNTAQTPHGGSYHLTMAATAFTATTNEAWLHLDLSGQTGIQLDFWWVDYEDEDNGSDGIYFSDDGGSNFTKVYDFAPTTETDGVYKNFVFDVDALASGAGLSLNNTFVVKFQQRDDYILGNDGMGFDDLSVYTTTMAYSSSTATQNTIDVNSNSTEQHIIGIEVVMTGSVSPLDITDLVFNTNGTTTTGDIANAKVFYTGNTNSFSTGSQFGSTIANPNGIFNVSGTQTLASGTNYFWLTYDVLNTATGGNIVDAEITQLTVDGVGYNPSVTAPVGSRTINMHYYAEFPYFTSFETGFIENEWEISDSGGNGQTQVNTGNNPRTGNYHMTMERASPGADEENYADLFIDLSGQTDVDLEFYMQDFGDEYDVEDGIWLSDDAGANFTQVYDIDPREYTNGEWNRILLDLDVLATTYGLNLNSTFVIRFVQRDNAPIANNDGISFDDISVRPSPCNNPIFATLPYSQGFESGYLGEEWCTPIIGEARTTITSEYGPYVGNSHLAMDAIVDAVGFHTNEAWLHLDLSSEIQVALEFWWKEEDDENHAEDGVFISDDGGATFTQILTFVPESVTDDTWTFQSLDITAEAANAGLTLSSQFVIKFSHRDNRSLNAGTEDGMLFDEVFVYANQTNWTGAIDNDWEDNGNWDNNTPNCSTIAVIPDVSGSSNNFPIVNAISTNQVGGLIIQNGASLTVNANRTLNICGNFTNYGSSNVGNGEIAFVGISLQEVDGPTDFGDLTINNIGNKIRLLDDISVDGTLTLIDGIVDTNYNEITMNDGANTTGASENSFVDGPMRKLGVTPSSFEFPLGDGTNWAPLGIDYQNGDASTVFTVEYFYETYLNVTSILLIDPNGKLDSVSTTEYWELSNSGTGTTVDLTLHWKNRPFGQFFSPLKLRVSHWQGTEWENIGMDNLSINGLSGFIMVSNVSNFSPFSFGSTDVSTPLPVDLEFFNADISDNNVHLTWITNSEQNNDFFEVQKSTSEIKWEVISRIKGQGTVVEPFQYQYIDEHPYFGRSFYRLKQVDFNGQFRYSDVRNIYLSPDKVASRIRIYPNPTDENDINIYFPTELLENNISIKIYNPSGLEIMRREFRVDQMSTVMKLNLPPKIPQGIYVVYIAQGNFHEKCQLIITD